MAVVTKHINIKTNADGGMVDVSRQVQQAVSESGLENGIAVVFIAGSTGALSTVEYEPGLMKDIPQALERIAPRDIDYAHHQTWHDDNGRGHVRATFIGPDLTVPFVDGSLCLGTWQQIVFIECDTRDRSRKLVVQVIGE
jgi:secondary thiamine-phosphate synthase enzyme